jgi:isopentenyl-diphosphate delta-isomerase
MSTSSRKEAHIKICLEREVETGDTLFGEVFLVHQALPEADLDSIDTCVHFLGKNLAFPLIIAGMTGGCSDAVYINKTLARIAEKRGLAFGVGSQRAMVEEKGLSETYAVRDAAPNILLLGNIGVTALKQYPAHRIAEAADNIEADALCVHLNPAQELFQEEGDRDFTGCNDALSEFCQRVQLPVVAKEVGNGISRETANHLKSSGICAIDVGGFGGTNWVIIDGLRSGIDTAGFSHWGIPTAVSLIESRVGLPLIATGGIRTGLQMAKAIALGAEVCGIALPFLRALLRGGEQAVESYIDSLILDFRQAMYLTGCQNMQHLKKVRYIMTGGILEWCGPDSAFQRDEL